MNDDMALVRAYATDQSESAFETLAARYVNLVYSTAVRQARDPHLAEEITQVVFMILARKAGRLGPRTILPSWLHRTAGFVAADALKKERRREQREQEAYMQSTLDEPENEAWRQIAPMLDAAIARLSDKDRHAVVLRFFENRSLSEIGDALGASEDAAKMRVSRALEKLRLFFSKRGVGSTAATIAAAISANSVQAAPATLANSVAAVAITKGAAASGSTVALMNGALKIMAWANLKSAAVVGAVMVLAAGATTALIAHHQHPAGAAGLPPGQKQVGAPISVPGIPENLTRNLVLYFNFDSAPTNGRIADLSGHGNNGEAVNVRWVADRHLGGVLVFSPTDSHIRVSNSESLNPPQFTLYAWIKTSRAGHYWRRIFDKGLFHDNFCLSIAGDWTHWKPPAKYRGFLEFEMPKTPETTSHHSLADGQWHQIAATYDGHNKQLFVDGQLQVTTRHPGVLLGNDFDLVIGGFTDPDPQNDDPHASFDGSLDDVMMFNRALSPEEIAALYHSQNRASDAGNGLSTP